jgi:hypothetical protein
MIAKLDSVDLSGSDCDHQKLGVIGWEAGGNLWLNLIDEGGNSDNFYLARDQATKLADLLNELLATEPVRAV